MIFCFVFEVCIAVDCYFSDVTRLSVWNLPERPPLRSIFAPIMSSFSECFDTPIFVRMQNANPHAIATTTLFSDE